MHDTWSIERLTGFLLRCGVNPDGYGERIGETREEHVARTLEGRTMKKRTKAEQDAAYLRVTKVRLLVDKHYPAAWVIRFAPIPAGTVVPVAPASNLRTDRYWVNTPELKDDAYGILLEPGEYEIVEES